MAIRNIVKEGEEILRKKCRKVEVFDERLHTLLFDMAETMYKADGAGLAAPQVGILRRCIVLDDGEGLRELINPEIIEEEGEQRNIEGCLSCPGEYGFTLRPKKVTVKAQDRDGKEIKVTGEDFLARILCHEIDHLDGIIFKEKAINMLTEEELEQISGNEK